MSNEYASRSRTIAVQRSTHYSSLITHTSSRYPSPIMPRIDLQHLPDDSRIWLFGISPQLDDAKHDIVTKQVDAFLDAWASHGTPITGAAAVVDHTFLVVGIDKQAEASGCSIDRMFGLLRDLERDLGVKILDSDRVFFRHGDGRIDA